MSAISQHAVRMSAFLREHIERGVTNDDQLGMLLYPLVQQAAIDCHAEAVTERLRRLTEVVADLRSALGKLDQP